MFVLTELGTRLREAREANGYSLDDLQNMTKIQKRYLMGIEEGNYEMMPGKFYVRAFIKQYAEAVGLDPERIFEEYPNDIPVTNAGDLPELSRVQSRKPVSESSSKVLNIIPKILVALFVIGAVFVVWYLLPNTFGNDNAGTGNDQEESVDYSESPEVQQPEDEDEETAESGDSAGSSEEGTDSEENEENEEDAEEPAEQPSQEITVAKVSGKETTYDLKNAENFNLNIAASGDTWIGVYNSKDEQLFSQMMKNGDSESFDLSEDGEAFIIVGNAPAATIKVNDEQINYEVSASEVVRQDIIIRRSAQE
ncbi:helix-turn-helix domain-containing protein [Rossellomorea vietnamensis]|uniref:Helix-turn-helix domain-containing protein n=1 Tax=Rossellomorea vietnamensis TaxID=218284 RepID=A0A5D4KKT8_9BACI|nr:helix-turn-helix domain-containing protein [Rossellomorea vietnamensis]